MADTTTLIGLRELFAFKDEIKDQVNQHAVAGDSTDEAIGKIIFDPLGIDPEAALEFINVGAEVGERMLFDTQTAMWSGFLAGLYIGGRAGDSALD